MRSVNPLLLLLTFFTVVDSVNMQNDTIYFSADAKKKIQASHLVQEHEQCIRSMTVSVDVLKIGKPVSCSWSQAPK